MVRAVGQMMRSLRSRLRGSRQLWLVALSMAEGPGDTPSGPPQTPARGHPGRTPDSLDALSVLQTIRRLEARIAARFPASGLLATAGALARLAEQAADQAARLARPIGWVRGLIAAVVLLVAIAAGWGIQQLPLSAFGGRVIDAPTGLTLLDAAANLALLAGAALLSLFAIEGRIKRRRAGRVLHRLRALIHVIDMRQLTKDPSMIDRPVTPASPRRTLSRFELERYLDYCSELLALASKLAALFAQSMDDPETREGASDIEQLATNLAQKIWQKIAILQTVAARQGMD
jgi:hypothetical protein